MMFKIECLKCGAELTIGDVWWKPIYEGDEVIGVRIQLECPKCKNATGYVDMFSDEDGEGE